MPLDDDNANSTVAGGEDQFGYDSDTRDPRDDGYDWLPPNFRTPQDLLTSYTFAQRKITEQGNELAALRQQLEEIAAGEFEPEPEPLQTIEAPRADSSRIAEAAAQLLAGRRTPSVAAAVNPDAVLREAEALVADQIPGYWERRDRMVQTISSDPRWEAQLAHAMQSGQPAAAAQLFAAAQSAVQAADSSRNMKLAAQGITGSGSRPDPVAPAEEHWARVAEAGMGTYAELRS